MPIANVSEKGVPHNLESERALLGCILLDNRSLPAAQELIEKDDLFSQGHRLIFQKMGEMASAGRTIDLVTLSEALDKDGTLQKAGGAAYLAGLTDGVPMGVNGLIVPEYCHIIKEKAEARALLTLSSVIQERVQLGVESPEETMDLVRTLIAAPSTAAKPTVATHTVYPVIPDEAWYGVSKLYRFAMARTSEASDNFHFAAFLSAAAALLGRSVAVGPDEDAYVYPNIFMLLVGDSGTGKEQAARRALKWMRRCDPKLFVTNHITSAETLIDEMAEAKKKLGDDHKGPFPTLLYLGELRNLIEKSKQKGAGTVVSKLCEVYDNPEIWSAKARGQPTSWINDPAFNLLACSNPDWMKDLDKKDLEGGLGSRVCITPGDPKPPDRNWQRPEAEAFQALVERMQSVRLAYPVNQTRRFEITPEANAVLDKWYIKQKSLKQSDSLIRFLGVRDILHVYKTALIHAACDLAGQIEFRHVQPAIAYVDYLADIRPVVFQGHGLSFSQLAQQEVEQILRSRKKITYSEALHLFHKGDAILFKRIIDAMSVEGGPVGVQVVKAVSARKPKRWLIWQGEA